MEPVFLCGFEYTKALFEIGDPAFKLSVAFSEVLEVNTVLSETALEKIQDIGRPFLEGAWRNLVVVRAIGALVVDDFCSEHRFALSLKFREAA